jgi:hypothetical protein
VSNNWYLRRNLQYATHRDFSFSFAGMLYLDQNQFSGTLHRDFGNLTNIGKGTVYDGWVYALLHRLEYLIACAIHCFREVEYQWQ